MKYIIGLIIEIYLAFTTTILLLTGVDFVLIVARGNISLYYQEEPISIITVGASLGFLYIAFVFFGFAYVHYKWVRSVLLNF